MSDKQVHILGIGLVSPAGVGTRATWEALRGGERHIGELTLFPASARASLPVAEVPLDTAASEVPRTHQLALIAAREALAGAGLEAPPEAIVLGGTTGGISLTEELLRDGVETPEAYRWHGAGTVADLVADEIGCRGPVLTVATACSSGAVALKVALELIRSGRARTVLAGGVDALCRLTYHGFGMLKVIDPEGARPFDVDRAGMTVGEGAALLLLASAEVASTTRPLAVLLGGGLSCDAYHPSPPHPEGAGALSAMLAALADAGLDAEAIDQVLLHGTGTRENDAAEARAVRALFQGRGEVPFHSSIKGSFGHAVGAAGAMGAAVSVLSLRDGVVPGNVGCQRPDPDLGLSPTATPLEGQSQEVVLTNALGFGGNNASLVIARPGFEPPDRLAAAPCVDFAVVAASCVTGAGLTEASLERLALGERLAGVMEARELVAGLPTRRIRRIKRLPRLALALTAELGDGGEPPSGVGSLFLGTSWGALSETHDFLTRLFESGETVSSPTDFVGTVHNAVTGQVAMWLGAKGANITATTGAGSFEDALLLASLLTPAGQAERLLVIGADEAHPLLSPRLDPQGGAALADGGGALLLEPARADDSRVTIRLALATGAATDAAEETLLGLAVEAGALWYSFPEAERERGELQLEALRAAAGVGTSLLDVRETFGPFATASAAATALSALAHERGLLGLSGRPVLILRLGERLSAIQVFHT